MGWRVKRNDFGAVARALPDAIDGAVQDMGGVEFAIDQLVAHRGPRGFLGRNDLDAVLLQFLGELQRGLKTFGETLADIARSLHVTTADFEHAAELARCLGFPLDPNLVPLLPA